MYNHNWLVIENGWKHSYVKPEGDGLMPGLFEWTGASCNDKEIQNIFLPGEKISPDWDHIRTFLRVQWNLYHSSLNVGAKKLVC